MSFGRSGGQFGGAKPGPSRKKLLAWSCANCHWRGIRSPALKSCPNCDSRNVEAGTS